MDQINIILLVVALAGTVFGACGFIFPKLKAKGVELPAALDVAKASVTGAGQVTDVLKAFFPNNPVVNIVDKVIDYAKIGVAKAEQLHKINEISKDERKAEALKFVYEALELAGVEITPAIGKIVDGSVEAAVLALGHMPDTADDGEGYGLHAAT